MEHDELDHLLVPRPDDIVDRKYRVRERLGAGGMGIVFRVEHIHTGRTYALKVLWPALAATPEGQRRFEAEARAIGALRHPNEDRHIHELWRLPSGDVGEGDLTSAAHAQEAAGNPSIYVNPSAQTHLVLFRGADRHIHSLYWTTETPRWDRLSQAAHAPQAAGDPVGFYTPETDTHHVIYVGDQGQLHTLYWVGAETAQYGDTTAGTGAPPAVGVPSPFRAPGVNVIVYRSRDNHVRTAYWSNDGGDSDDLSGFVGTPDAAGDPVAYYYAGDNTQQVTYRGVDNHLYELFWVGAAPAAGWDVTAAAGAPPAAGDPAALSIAATNTKHVVYRSADGHLHEISWVRGRSDAVDLDLTIAALAPLAANRNRPVAFTVDGASRRHVMYTGDDGHVHEIYWP